MSTSYRRALAAACGLALLAGLGTATGSVAIAPVAAPVVTADPTATPAGPAPVEPYLVEGRSDGGQLADRVIVDGALRVPVAGRKTVLLGTRGSDYVVVVPNRLLRVSPDGSTRRLARGVNGAAVLSEDGRLAAMSPRGGKATRPQAVRVVDTRTGRVVSRRSFTGSPTVLAVDGRDVVVTRGGVGSVRAAETVRWDRRKDAVIRITKHRGTLADVTSNRLAVQSRLPRSCTTVVRLSNGKRVWRDCDASSVDSFGPDGSSVTRASSGTFLPSRRDRAGDVVAVYDTSTFPAFGGDQESSSRSSRWEGDQVLVAGVAGAGSSDVRYGLSRCSTTACQPAGPTWSITLASQ